MWLGLHKAPRNVECIIKINENLITVTVHSLHQLNQFVVIYNIL